MARKRSNKKHTARRRWEWRCKMRLALLVRDGNHCKLCGVHLVLARGREDSISVDHKIPRSVGGSDGVDNLQLTCAKCNHAKGGRTQ